MGHRHPVAGPAAARTATPRAASSDEGEADDRLVAWERTSAECVTGGDTHIMTPLPRTVYGPPDWEDALDSTDWLRSWRQ